MGNRADSIVDRIGAMNFNGNIIPHAWSTHPKLRGKNGLVNMAAVNVLADLLYWYRPTVIRDEETGRVTEKRKRFRSDMLQKSYGTWGIALGLTKCQMKNAVKFLCTQGIVRIEFRTVQNEYGRLPNVMFIEPVVEVVQELAVEIPTVQCTPPSSPVDTCASASADVCTAELTRVHPPVDTSASASTDVCTPELIRVHPRVDTSASASAYITETTTETTQRLRTDHRRLPTEGREDPYKSPPALAQSETMSPAATGVCPESSSGEPSQSNAGSRISTTPRPIPAQVTDEIDESPRGSTSEPPADVKTSPGFDQFWTAWPASSRKFGRPQCCQKWHVANLEPLALKIITAVEAFKKSHDWTKEGGRFIPKPLTWLDDCRWEATIATEGPPPAADQEVPYKGIPITYEQAVESGFRTAEEVAQFIERDRLQEKASPSTSEQERLRELNRLIQERVERNRQAEEDKMPELMRRFKKRLEDASRGQVAA